MILDDLLGIVTDGRGEISGLRCACLCVATQLAAACHISGLTAFILCICGLAEAETKTDSTG
ncbi:MAG: hypothetical protein AAF250_02730 [Pseudomonadota bacterium]